MPYKEKNIERKYYTIGEVAEMFKVNTSLIRFWENEFAIIKPKKNRKGNRQFTLGDIDNVKLVYHLVKVKGHTLEGAKEVIRSNAKATRDTMELIRSLKDIKAFLIEVRDRFS